MLHSKPELTLDKMQLISMANVGAVYKTKWIKLFNSSIQTRDELCFPSKPANDEKIGAFLVKACWWAGVSFVFNNF